MKTIKAKVIMLPTDDHIKLWDIIKHNDDGRIGMCKCSPKNSDGSNHHDLNNWTSQHLYITTDEEVKEVDWYVLGKQVRQATGDLGKPDEGKYLKIIATTDPKLTLKDGHIDYAMYPKEVYKHKGGIAEIPQSFIEEYCKAGGIDEVLVEYWEGTVNKPKTDVDNCIIIHPVEEKIYSREEVIDLLHKMHRMVFNLSAVGDPCGESKRDKWIKENL